MCEAEYVNELKEKPGPRVSFLPSAVHTCVADDGEHAWTHMRAVPSNMGQHAAPSVFAAAWMIWIWVVSCADVCALEPGP